MLTLTEQISHVEFLPWGPRGPISPLDPADRYGLSKEIVREREHRDESVQHRQMTEEIDWKQSKFADNSFGLDKIKGQLDKIRQCERQKQRHKEHHIRQSKITKNRMSVAVRFPDFDFSTLVVSQNLLHICLLTLA